METQKVKVKGLDVLLQVLIALFSLAWIGLMGIELESWGLLAEYNVDGVRGGGYRNLITFFEQSVQRSPETMLLFTAGIVFSIIVFVYVVFLFRKATATVVRSVFTFGLVLWSLQFYLCLCSFVSYLGDPEFNTDILLDLLIYNFDMIGMLLILLMLCFSMGRKKHKGLFIGQVICLVLMVVNISLRIAEIILNQEFGFGMSGDNVIFATGCFQMMLALLSIWLHRRNYYREKEVVATYDGPTIPAASEEPKAFVLPVEEEVASASEATVSPMVEEKEKTEILLKEEPMEATEEPEAESEEPVEVVPEPIEEEEVPMEAAEEPETVPEEPVEVVPEPIEEEEAPMEAAEEPEAESAEPEGEPEETQAEAPEAQEIKVMFCINCGAFLDDGVSFCGKCGTKVAE